MDVFAPQKGDIGAKKAIFLSKITYKFKKLAWPDPLGDALAHRGSKMTQPLGQIALIKIIRTDPVADQLLHQVF